MTFWGDIAAAGAAKQQPEPRAPSIPQSEPVPTGIEGFWEKAGELLEGPEPAQSVAQRFGQAPGGDIGVIARRPGPADEAAYQDGDRDRERRQTALAVKLATEAGAFDGEGSQAKVARDRAALVAEATRQGAWTTSEDNTPGRRVDPRGIAGFTAGHGYSG
jgi:hypothetical protein